MQTDTRQITEMIIGILPLAKNLKLKTEICLLSLKETDNAAVPQSVGGQLLEIVSLRSDQ